MKSIKIIFVLSLVFQLVVTTKAQKPELRFGIIADIQYADADTRGSRFYRNSIDKLKDCIIHFNQEKIGFVLNLGDITDRNPKDLDTILATFKNLRPKVYHTTGNHDFAGIKNPQEVVAKLEMPASYYSLAKKKWRLIMLNTNDVASYTLANDADKTTELKQMLDSIRLVKGKNAASYNGGIGKQQLAWLDSLLTVADKKKEKVILFSHHPFDFAPGLTALNSSTVLKIIDKHKSVKALISGHHHQGAFGYHNHIPCITLQGMVEQKATNAYAIIELYKDKIKIIGTGAVPSRELPYN